jgi:hypothetical protein
VESGLNGASLRFLAWRKGVGGRTLKRLTGYYESRGHGRHHGHQVNRSYQYQERVYLPPPVFYVPPPPPGIGIFLPPIFIHP